MVPPGPLEAVEIGVLVDRDHEALAMEAVAPGGEFCGTCGRISHREVQPPVWPVDAVLRDPLTTELRMRVVLVQAPVQDIGEPIGWLAVHSRPRVQPCGVADNHAAPVDGEVPEPDRYRPVRGLGPEKTEADLQGRDRRFPVERRRRGTRPHSQRPVGRCRDRNRLAQPLTKAAPSVCRSRPCALGQGLTQFSPLVDPSGHAKHQHTRRRIDSSQVDEGLRHAPIVSSLYDKRPRRVSVPKPLGLRCLTTVSDPTSIRHQP
jgi:hypothetical protein